MRTTRKTHNFKLREKGSAEQDGFEKTLCSEISSYREIHSLEVYLGGSK